MIACTSGTVVICGRYTATFGRVIRFWFINESTRNLIFRLFLVRHRERDVILQFSARFRDNLCWNNLRYQSCSSRIFWLTRIKGIDTISTYALYVIVSQNTNFFLLKELIHYMPKALTDFLYCSFYKRYHIMHSAILDNHIHRRICVAE